MSKDYPQAQEPNEYRYIDPRWLDEIATGLTAGAEKYGEGNWKSIPADEHAVRAMRHLNEYRGGDRKEKHLVNASMRCMMAAVMDRVEKKSFVDLTNNILAEFIEQVEYYSGCSDKMVLLMEKVKENIAGDLEVQDERV